MTRSAAREIAVQILFAYAFTAYSPEELLAEWLPPAFYQRMAEEDPLYNSPPDQDNAAYISRLVSGAVAHLPELDGYIAKYAVGWDFSRIPRAALAIMRAAMFEVLYMPDIPNAAALNEAVELVKHYEIPQVVSFVNGILGSFARAELPA